MLTSNSRPSRKAHSFGRSLEGLGNFGWIAGRCRGVRGSHRLGFAAALVLALLFCAEAVWKASVASAAIINTLVADTFVIFALADMPPPGANCRELRGANFV